MSNIEHWRALTVAAMNAGCDEAERLGYGSELGYVEACAISEAVIRVLADNYMGAVDVLRKIAADEGVVHDGIIDTDVPRRTAQAYLDAHGGQ